MRSIEAMCAASGRGHGWGRRCARVLPTVAVMGVAAWGVASTSGAWREPRPGSTGKVGTGSTDAKPTPQGGTGTAGAPKNTNPAETARPAPARPADSPAASVPREGEHAGTSAETKKDVKGSGGASGGASAPTTVSAPASDGPRESAPARAKEFGATGDAGTRPPEPMPSDAPQALGAVKVTSLEVVDARGRRQAYLGPAEGSSLVLSLYDAMGNVRLTLRIGPDGTPSESLYGDKSSESVRVYATRAGGRPEGFVRVQDRGGFLVMDSSGQMVSAFGRDENQSPVWIARPGKGGHASAESQK